MAAPPADKRPHTRPVTHQANPKELITTSPEPRVRQCEPSHAQGEFDAELGEKPVAGTDGRWGDYVPSPPIPARGFTMLTNEDIEAFAEDGFVRLGGAVPQAVVAPCRAASRPLF
jgi:hypothetical protein